MAKFPIIEARQELGFTPTTAVRADLDTRTGEGAAAAALGQGLVTIAGEVIKESKRKAAIRARNRKNLDSLSSRQADLLRKQRNGDIEVMKGSTPPEKWEEETLKIVTRFNDQIGGLDFSPEESAKQQIISISDLETVPEDAFIAGSRRISAATITSEEEKLTDDFRLGREDITQRKVDFITTMRNNGVAAPEILLKLKAAEEAGEKLRNEDAVKAKRNLASLNPDSIIEQMQVEKELRKRGKGLSENSALTNEDLEDIMDFAGSVDNKKDSDSQIVSSAAIETAYSQIRDGATNIDAMIDAIAINPTILDSDSNTAAEKIKTFFSTWNSAVKEKVITDNSIRIRALKIIGDVRSGNISEDSGLFQYEALESEEKINSADNKGFINSIFTAAEEARDVVKQRQAAILSEREKQLRDAIEQQISFLAPEESKEILKDFANIAVIEFNDKFREGEFKTDEIDTEVDRLMRKYSLSIARQTRAAAARQVSLAETLKEQQDETNKVIASLSREGKTQEAQDVLDEAIRLGIFVLEGNEIKKTKGKKVNLSKGLIKRMLGL
ncbi:MAG TPA: hypothetical protein ENI23_04765 [bacterium]|nr:hypothetical protein [bacterium]